MKKKEPGGACLYFLHPCGKNAAPCRLGWPGANPAERIAVGKEEQRNERTLTFEKSRNKRYAIDKVQ